MPIVREFTVYLNAGTAVPPPYINVNYNDSNERWEFTLLHGDTGQPYTPSSVSIIGKKADGNPVTVPGTVSDGKAIITETTSLTNCPGRGTYELHVDNNHGTANFTVMVEASPTEGAVVSESDLELIQQAVDAADRITQYGSPLQASSASQMTNQNSVYVYTGTTTSSLTNGHWYYWNGNAWTDGGVYNAVAVNTDTTLTLAGVPADAEAVGNRFISMWLTDEETEEILEG